MLRLDGPWGALSEGTRGSPVTAQLTTATQRFGGHQRMEMVRVPAAFAIVWYHSQAPRSKISCA